MHAHRRDARLGRDRPDRDPAGAVPDERRVPGRRGNDRRLRLLGPDHYRDGPHVRRAGPDLKPRHGGHHGRTAARQGRRGLGHQRHHPRARRDPGRGDRRFGDELRLRQPRAVRAADQGRRSGRPDLRRPAVGSGRPARRQEFACQGGLREGAADAVRQAFISGLHSGSLVAAGATAAAALVTLALCASQAPGPSRPPRGGCRRPAGKGACARGTQDRRTPEWSGSPPETEIPRRPASSPQAGRLADGGH